MNISSSKSNENNSLWNNRINIRVAIGYYSMHSIVDVRFCSRIVWHILAIQ